MSRRPLPSPAEAATILSRRRSLPPGRPPPPLGRSLSPLLKSLDEKFGKGPGALQARWREIVGEDLARRTEPVRLSRPRGGGPASLEIRVAGAVATLIQHQAPEIIARVNLFLGTATVGQVRIVQGPLQITPTLVRAARRKSPPLDAAKETELVASLGGTQDGPLKEALLRLGRNVLRGAVKTRV